MNWGSFEEHFSFAEGIKPRIAGLHFWWLHQGHPRTCGAAVITSLLPSPRNDHVKHWAQAVAWDYMENWQHWQARKDDASQTRSPHLPNCFLYASSPNFQSFLANCEHTLYCQLSPTERNDEDTCNDHPCSHRLPAKFDSTLRTRACSTMSCSTRACPM